MNDWNELVLNKLDDHGKKLDHQSRLITDLRIEVAKLKVRAGIWGTLAGFVGAAALVLVRGIL